VGYDGRFISEAEHPDPPVSKFYRRPIPGGKSILIMRRVVGELRGVPDKGYDLGYADPIETHITRLIDIIPGIMFLWPTKLHQSGWRLSKYGE
jgi:hypothetical protein